MNTTSTSFSFTGAIPANYDTYLGPFLFEFSAADMAKRVSAFFDKPAKVLEVACGTGISTRHLSNTLPAGTEIVATDLNDAMLAHAEKVNFNLPGVSYLQADALDLPFEDESFDAVVCQFGLMFFPDKPKGLTEMTRVLRPDGLLALNVWDSMEQNPAVIVVADVIEQFFETDAPRFLEVPFSMHDIDEGRRLLQATGYDAVETSYVAEAIEVSDFALPAAGFITGNPTLFEIEQRSKANVEDVVAAAATALESEFGPAPGKLSFQAIVYLANKPSS